MLKNICWSRTYFHDVLSPASSQLPYRRNLVSRFSSTSSSDIAPSLDESIESGPLSDLQSEEDEGRRSADRRLQLTAPLVEVRGGASLVHQLLEDIQNQDKDPDVWKKIEVWTIFLSVCLSVSLLWYVSFSLLWNVFLAYFFAQGWRWSACFSFSFHKSIIISSDTSGGSL